MSGYKYKIKLVWILRKREDQASISISTILYIYPCTMYMIRLVSILWKREDQASISIFTILYIYIHTHDKISLDIMKKRGSSINLDIHYFKVFSSEHTFRDKTVSTKSIAGVLIVKKIKKYKQLFFSVFNLMNFHK